MNGPLRHLIRVGCAFARSNSDQVRTVRYQPPAPSPTCTAYMLVRCEAAVFNPEA
jgi:hypothetical protein